MWMVEEGGGRGAGWGEVFFLQRMGPDSVRGPIKRLGLIS